jgi:hypothetical protein
MAGRNLEGRIGGGEDISELAQGMDPATGSL